jgi:hypothetical protein
MISEEGEPFEDVEADFANPGTVGTYMLSTRRPGVVGEEATE